MFLTRLPQKRTVHMTYHVGYYIYVRIKNTINRSDQLLKASFKRCLPKCSYYEGKGRTKKRVMPTGRTNKWDWERMKEKRKEMKIRKIITLHIYIKNEGTVPTDFSTGITLVLLNILIYATEYPCLFCVQCRVNISFHTPPHLPITVI
jgi:hypothetical protein